MPKGLKRHKILIVALRKVSFKQGAGLLSPHDRLDGPESPFYSSPKLGYLKLAYAGFGFRRPKP